MQAFFARAHTITQRVIDPLSRLALLLSAMCLVLMTVIVFAQITLRYLGIGFVWGSNVAGYALVAATFLAMAPTLRRDLHVRVGLVLTRVPERVRFALEVWSYVVGLFFTIYAARWCIIQVIQSYQFGDVSIGIVAFPLWIPQTFMAIGFCLFALAMLEGLLAVLSSKPPTQDEPTNETSGADV